MKTPYREALLSKFKFNKGLKSNRTKKEEEILTEWKVFLIPAFIGITIMTIGFFLAFHILLYIGAFFVSLSFMYGLIKALPYMLGD